MEDIEETNTKYFAQKFLIGDDWRISTSSPRLQITASAFRWRSRELWNRLPDNIRLLDNISGFKKHLRTWIVGRRSQNIEDQMGNNLMVINQIPLGGQDMGQNMGQNMGQAQVGQNMVQNMGRNMGQNMGQAQVGQKHGTKHGTGSDGTGHGTSTGGTEYGTKIWDRTWDMGTWDKIWDRDRDKDRLGWDRTWDKHRWDGIWDRI